MNAIKHTTLLVLCLILFFACNPEAQQEAILPQADPLISLEKKRNASDLPFRATFYTDLNLKAIADGEKDCSGSAEFTDPNIQTGEGNALHLGKFTTTLKFCGAFVANPTPEEAAAGLVFRYGDLEGYFKAANGDMLNLGLVGTGEIYLSDEPGYDLAFFDEFTITGGTGRFENATGTMTSSSFVNLTTQRTDHVWTGEISLDR